MVLTIFILSCVWSGESWTELERLGEKWRKGLIITINDTSNGDLPLIVTISDTSKNHPKRFDFDNTINLSTLIVSLVTRILFCVVFHESMSIGVMKD